MASVSVESLQIPLVGQAYGNLPVAEGSAPFEIMKHAATLALTIIKEREPKVYASKSREYVPVYLEAKPRPPVLLPSIFVFAPSSTTIIQQNNFVSQHNVSVIQSAPGNERRKEEGPDAATRALAGVAGVIITFVAAFFIGKAVAEYKEIKRENAPLKTEIKQWKDEENQYSKDVKTHTNALVEKIESILFRKKVNFATQIAFLTAVVAAGVFLVAGAVAASYVTLAIGGGILLVAGAARLGKWAYDHFSKEDLHDAKDITKQLGKFPKEDMDPSILVQPSLGSDDPSAPSIVEEVLE